MLPNAASTPTSAGVTVPPEVWAQPSVSPSNDSHDEEEALEATLALSPRPINSIPPIDTIITSPACKNNINTSSPTGWITKLNEYNYSTGKPLDPPPCAQFLTMDDLLHFCHTWAKEHGYAVFKVHSNANKNVYIRCDCLGKYHGTIMNPSGRKAAMSKIMCPFEVKGSIPTSKKITNKTWTLEIRHGKHNHEVSSKPSSHTSHKKLLPEQYKEIRKLLQLNLKPAQILLQLQTLDNETYATNKTVSNALQKIRRKDLDGRSPIEALVCVLKETNWSYDVKVKDDGVVQNLFFAHPGSIHLTWINHHVALLDSTYKTNRYQLPLLLVIGQSASNWLFSIAFCFLACKDSDS
ncbi:hypothetical protein PCANC_03347 [Puccinia coronata f. sp. avenae]|uniref:Uncharacterized protein n=1 Tax=Puccinia coronata f. sp. avenae TaxID=200324 RepID=A0A2N5T8U2_9BASI|nr:hypothetical protein PCANC_03347 [Puccinia coronata f. sp. avenae]